MYGKIDVMINAIGSVLKKVFGTKNDRELKRMAPIVERVNSLEEKMRSLRDEDFLHLTDQFKARIRDGEGLDNVLPEAYALVREAARRRLNMRHFDVQLVGGVVLHEGKIAEMKTGEGKTLVATLPLYLNALAGRGAHLVTVNDYLARRDTQWMGPIYHALGLSVGVIQHETSYMYDPTYRGEDKSHFHLRPCSRKEAYLAEITYGTNNEFGFDYLRDNMKFSLEDYVQRELFYAIVDEVDSILVDEARTPLIISGPAEESTDKYYRIDSIIPLLNGELHYTVDEKARQVHLTEEGMQRVEELLKIDNLYDPRHIDTLHHVNQALRAHVLFKRDVDYVVKDGKVIIVDEFTGRLMPGRRWSDGLHQAIEAKERVEIENENQTLASITFQNYFRMYEKLAGMTGTADTEAHEFKAIYNLDVVVVPTHRPMIRNDHPDLIYKTKKEKFRAVVREIEECYRAGRPVLVGTISIEDSEKLSSMLKREGVPHNVLNAKHHEREAEIVAQAGRLHAVTLSTNMAGRGTDIILGGNPEFLAKAKAGFDDTTEEYRRAYEEAKRTCEEEKKKVLELGGLHIIGTERHESRRIDNQLRGRSGRQGDPGSSRFYISLEDDLMRIFGSDRVAAIMDRLGMEEDTPIEHSLVTKAVESAQKKVEAHNFDIRKHLLEYDDVMNQQRQTIYEYRKQILAEQGLHEMIKEFVEEVVADMVDSVAEEKRSPEEWNLKGLCDHLFSQFAVKVEPDELEGVRDREELSERLFERLWKHYEEKRARIGDDVMGHVEKIVMLHTLDTLWKDHLLTMDHLKGGIGLRGYGQKNPLNEYKREGYQLFTEMIQRLRTDVTGRLFKVEVQEETAVSELEERAGRQNMTLSRGPEPQATGTENARAQPVRRAGKKVGRNEPCPCGSGRKYKKCCGR